MRRMCIYTYLLVMMCACEGIYFRHVEFRCEACASCASSVSVCLCVCVFFRICILFTRNSARTRESVGKAFTHAPIHIQKMKTYVCVSIDFHGSFFRLSRFFAFPHTRIHTESHQIDCNRTNTDVCSETNC